jgi:hypothetical protein
MGNDLRKFFKKFERNLTIGSKVMSLMRKTSKKNKRDKACIITVKFRSKVVSFLAQSSSQIKKYDLFEPLF